MTYPQLEYYYKNREKILEKNRMKAKDSAKYNNVCNVRHKKKIIEKKIDLKVKFGKFIITFD